MDVISYNYPIGIYFKYFPNGNIDEFDKAFVSFDVSEEEFYQLTNGDSKYICLETVIFDKSLIKTSISSEILKDFGHSLDLDDTQKAYNLENINISWIDYSKGNNEWEEEKYYNNFNKWWDNLDLNKKEQIFYKLNKNKYRK